MTIEPVSDPTDPADRSEALDLLTDTTARLDALRQRLVTGKTVPMSASLRSTRSRSISTSRTTRRGPTCCDVPAAPLMRSVSTATR